MKVRRAMGYFLRESMADLWKRRTVNIVSIATIAATLYILGLFMVGLTGVTRAVSAWGEENRVSVYLVDEASDANRAALQEKLSKNSAAQSVEYVSKEEALLRFRRDFPDLADLAAGLDSNPLPASFEVTMRASAATPEAIEAFAHELGTEPGVDGVRYDLVWVRRIRALLRIVAWSGAVLGAVLLGASIVTISGVIRLNVIARKDEIEILRLVGATRGFIRGPFLFEGAFQGAAAALLAAACIAATWTMIGSSAQSRLGPVLAGLLGGAMPLWAPPALLAIGLAIGLAGSLLSVRRAFSAA